MTMRKLIVYIAASFNGKIAKPDGSVHWLEAIPNPEKSDYGYQDFFKSIDITIQGNSSYQQIISWDIPFPYQGTRNYVFTRNKTLKDTDDVKFISADHTAFVKALKKEKGKDIWLIGGGQMVTSFLNANLIDEFQVFIMPIILSEGIDLFAGIPDEKNLELIDTKSYSSGVVRLRYKPGK